MEDDPRAGTLKKTLASFLQVWEQEITLHQREEEELLLPLYSRYPSELQARYELQVLEEHRWQALRVSILRESGGDGAWELLGVIGRTLDKHIRFEERVLFPQLEMVMSNEDLARLEAASRAFRQHYRPHAIGPR